MDKEERKEWQKLMDRVIALNGIHRELSRQVVVLGEQLSEQFKEIVKVHNEVGDKLNEE